MKIGVTPECCRFSAYDKWGTDLGCGKYGDGFVLTVIDPSCDFATIKLSKEQASQLAEWLLARCEDQSAGIDKNGQR